MYGIAKPSRTRMGHPVSVQDIPYAYGTKYASRTEDVYINCKYNNCFTKYALLLGSNYCK